MLRVNYYGEVFATSGYGTAVRAYIHALHAAGVDVRIVGVGRPPSQFDDHLIRSLLGHPVGADFTIVHAIPSFWPRWVYAQQDVITVTVWEADPVPRSWLRALNHAIDVWVPCAFNVDSFSRAMTKKPFCLPYPLMATTQTIYADQRAQIDVAPREFLFYGIFDWQYRKNAEGTIDAFLRAFPEDDGAVLLLKTIPQAAQDARQTLVHARLATGSRARVILCCESLSEGQVDALHERGDCYVSLHRGEGWGYPLFEAAARGKPTIASAQGGPIDFLDRRRHQLIPCQKVPVQQPYFLFTRDMQWGEPEISAAVKAFRWVYHHREEARANAIIAAAALNDQYSLGRIGEAAKSRLLELRARLTSA